MTKEMSLALGREAPLKLGPRVIPHSARSAGSDSCAGIARSFTQSQYGTVTSGLIEISAASSFARYSRCQLTKLRPSIGGGPIVCGPQRSEEHTSELQSRENLV